MAEETLEKANLVQNMQFFHLWCDERTAECLQMFAV
jgi:hypothetical protein